MCSSRNRPHYLREMIISFLRTRTKGFTNLIVYVWKDDPQIEEYKKLSEEFKEIKFIFGKKRFMAEVLNYLSSKYEYDYYQEINDDHYYITEGWDVKMVKIIEDNGGVGICSPNSNYKHEDYRIMNDKKVFQPSAAIVSGNIVRKLGCFCLKGLRQIGVDDYLRILGVEANILYQPRDIIIEHRCWHVQEKREKDENDIFIYEKDGEHGYSLLKKWEETQKKFDLKKIEELKNEKKTN